MVHLPVDRVTDTHYIGLRHIAGSYSGPLSVHDVAVRNRSIVSAYLTVVDCVLARTIARRRVMTKTWSTDRDARMIKMRRAPWLQRQINVESYIGLLYTTCRVSSDIVFSNEICQSRASPC